MRIVRQSDAHWPMPSCMPPAWRPHSAASARSARVSELAGSTTGTLDVETIEEVRKLCLANDSQAQRDAAELVDGLASRVRGFQRLSQSNVQEVLSTLVLDGLVCASPDTPHLDHVLLVHISSGVVITAMQLRRCAGRGGTCSDALDPKLHALCAAGTVWCELCCYCAD